MTLPTPLATPLLSLELFRERLGYNPWHFFQLSNSTTTPRNSSCNDLVYEHEWQNASAVGRAEIRRALVLAQEQLASWLRYDVAPAYREDTVAWPRLADAAWDRTGQFDQRGQFLSVILPRTQIQRIGYQRTTLIGNASVTYTDENGDGLDDTFTVSIATSVTDTAQLGVYVAATDRYDGSGLSQRWRIAPVRVSVSGGIATITGRAWLAVRPVLYEESTQAINPADATRFCATMDVARHYIDPDGITADDCQATLIYGPDTGDPASVGEAVARAGIRDAANGIVAPALATYDATSGTWSSTAWACGLEPNGVLVRYEAGVPLVDGRMDPYFEELVFILTLANIPGPICACKEANKRLYHYQFDLARTGGANGEGYGLISGEDLSNPYGTRRGQVEAWKRVSQRRRLRSFAL